MGQTNFAPTSGGGGGSWTGTYANVVTYGDSSETQHDASFQGTSNPFYFTMSSLPTYITITSVVIFGYWRYGQTNNPGAYVYYGYSGGSALVATLNGSVPAGTYFSTTVSRPGGGSWTRADLQSAYFYLISGGQGTPTPLVAFDQILSQVNWTYIVLSPTVSAASNITATGARLNGSCAQNGDAGAQRYFEWGTSSGNYSVGNSGWAAVNGSTYYDIASGLTPGQQYFFRMRAQNSGGEQFYSSELSFTTLKGGCLIMVD